jgi:hypothetical protein
VPLHVPLKQSQPVKQLAPDRPVPGPEQHAPALQLPDVQSQFDVHA